MANKAYTPNNLNPADLRSKIASDTGLSYPVPNVQNGAARFEPVKTKEQFESWLAQNRKKQADLGTSLNQYGIDREPWIFTTFETISQAADLLNPVFNSGGYNSKASQIFWTANPKSISWQIAQRASEEKNKSGTVLHVWRDRLRKTDYDDPRITINFQSGSIHPIMEPEGQKIAPGLNNFYQYLELVDSPKITASGEANLIHILYRSTIFPSIVLTGFFDPQMVVQFTDDSQNPYQITGWSVNFTIYDTVPKLNKLADLRDRFQSDGLIMNGNYTNEVRSPNKDAYGYSGERPTQTLTGDFGSDKKFSNNG